LKQFKSTLVIMAAFLATLGISATASAFHSGGVAECGGCHSMHSPAADGSFLLQGNDLSSTCLNCHEGSAGSYHISTAEASLGAGQAPLQKTPGGDFGWLKKTYTFTVRGTVNTEEGETHGHNIVAADFGYVASTHTVSPGGSYPTSQLSCASCHDPHGKRRRLDTGAIASSGAPIVRSGSYNTSAAPAAGEAVGVYRLLQGSSITNADFNGNPAAVVPSTYNRTEATTQTRTAYGNASGGGHVQWGTWCATCHGDMHSSGNYVHPVDESLGSTVAGVYQTYKKTGDLTGSAATSYLSLTPFITNSSDYTALAALALNDDSDLNGPGQNDQVSCLSCHRAHASGWEYSLRWNMEGEFITYNGAWPGTDNGAPVQFARGRTSAETQAAYYDRPATNFATYQRVLCNKCHAKD
jgi:cytochrome c553